MKQVWNCSVFVFFVGVFSNEYLPMAMFVEDADKRLDKINSVKRAAPQKAMCSPLSDNSPHIGHWTKASTGWIFLKDGKPAFTKQTLSQNGWIIKIGAVQNMWRTLNSAGFDYLETRSLNQGPLENTFVVIRLHCGSKR